MPKPASPLDLPPLSHCHHCQLPSPLTATAGLACCSSTPPSPRPCSTVVGAPLHLPTTAAGCGFFVPTRGRRRAHAPPSTTAQPPLSHRPTSTPAAARPPPRSAPFERRHHGPIDPVSRASVPPITRVATCGPPRHLAPLHDGLHTLSRLPPGRLLAPHSTKLGYSEHTKLLPPRRPKWLDLNAGTPICPPLAWIWPAMPLATPSTRRRDHGREGTALPHEACRPHDHTGFRRYA